MHYLGFPQAGLFPVFPWTGFAFAGLALGFILQSDWVRTHEVRSFLAAGAIGGILIEISRWLDAMPSHVYPVYDYWHTSPQFFLVRVGMLLVIVTGSYAWCRWGAGQWGFSPLIQLGQASLLFIGSTLNSSMEEFPFFRSARKELQRQPPDCS